MEECLICGQLCEGEHCPDCIYRMESHDSLDIWERVQKFDNSRYEMDQVKIDICKYYGCSLDDIMQPGRKEPQTTVRMLFIYMLVRRWNIKQCRVAEMFKINHATVNHICHKFDAKFQKNIAIEKILHILKY